MTLAFQGRQTRNRNTNARPESEALTEARLRRLRSVVRAAPMVNAGSGVISAMANLPTADDPVHAAPWEASGAGIWQAVDRRRLAAVVLPIVLIGLGFGALVVRTHATPHSTPDAVTATAAIDAASAAQLVAEQPLPQDLAAMASDPAVATGAAAAAVLKALSQPPASGATTDTTATAATTADGTPADATAIEVIRADATTASAPSASDAVSAGGAWTRTPPPPAAPAPAVAATASAPVTGWGRANPLPAAAPMGTPAEAAIAKQAAIAPRPAPASQAGVTWPARGPLTSLYGPLHPLGVDIGIPLGTPLHAVAAGRVAFTGGDSCCSYGYYIDIDHGNGVMTRYGHLIQPSFMQPGELVRPGDVIGYSGSTGNSTGPHLHFEIRLYGRPVDPLLVLP